MTLTKVRVLVRQVLEECENQMECEMYCRVLVMGWRRLKDMQKVG